MHTIASKWWENSYYLEQRATCRTKFPCQKTQIADMQSKGTAQPNQTFSQTNRNHHENTLMKSYDETRRTINNRKIQIHFASSRRYNSHLRSALHAKLYGPKIMKCNGGSNVWRYDVASPLDLVRKLDAWILI